VPKERDDETEHQAVGAMTAVWELAAVAAAAAAAMLLRWLCMVLVGSYRAMVAGRLF